MAQKKNTEVRGFLSWKGLEWAWENHRTKGKLYMLTQFNYKAMNTAKLSIIVVKAGVIPKECEADVK